MSHGPETPDDLTAADDASLRELEACLRPLRAAAPPLPALPARPPSRSFRPALAALAALLVLASGLAVFLARPRPAWDVTRLEGAGPERGRLARGEWLETGAGDRAEIAVGAIGRLEVEPRTRLRLVSTSRRDHRIDLAKGTIRARIWAPPRLFFVETPSATAVDLGCAYTLTVGDDGEAVVSVTSGWVAFETRDGRTSRVPAGASCRVDKAGGPRAPWFDDVPPGYVESLRVFEDAARGSAARADALAVLLGKSRARDGLTLLALVPGSTVDERGRILGTLERLATAPRGTGPEAFRSADPAALRAWAEALDVPTLN